MLWYRRGVNGKRNTMVKGIISRVNQLFMSERERYGIRYYPAIAIIILPFLIVLLFGLSMVFPQTRGAALFIVQENRPVELLTFVFLLSGSLQGLYLAGWARSKKRPTTWLFYAVFSLGLLFVAMEEIAWGQQFFGFSTPYFIKTVNEQRELTFHNLHGLQGHSEFFHSFFGIGGLIGIWLGSRSHVRLREIGVPLILLTWFLVITAVSGLDLYNDYFPIEKKFDRGMRWMSEIVEMLIGVAGFLYVWLMTRKLKGYRS